MITVLADDLTGAAEVAGVCLRYGLKTAFGVNALPSEEAEAWVIATDSRSMSETEARELHRQLAVSLKVVGRTSVFKKTDSVLRGHVVAELAGLMAVCEIKKVLLQPANPSVGRCIKAGVYLIDGIPLHQTAFAADPDYPATSASVDSLLQTRSEQLFEGNAVLSNYTNLPHSNSGAGIYTPDCLSEDELKNGLQLLGDDCIFAGSAAFFAAYLEEKIGLKQQVAVEKINPLAENFLMICGSAHAQSRNFIEKARQRGWRVAELPAALLIEKTNDTALLAWADEQMALWRQEGRLIVKIATVQLSFPNCATVLKERLAKIVNRLLQNPARELLIEGGATAYAILLQQGWSTLVPLQELAPGVVRMAVAQSPGLFLTLKPGSYGWPEMVTLD